MIKIEEEKKTFSVQFFSQYGRKINKNESSMSGLKKILIILFKILYFISISVIFIFWWIFKDIVENQDLYRKKDDK